MREIKRPAKVGEIIKITREYNRLGGSNPYPLGSTWLVEEVVDEKKGLIFCKDNQFGEFMEDYVVLE
ncbi:hypothetical protein [Bacillus thuringiensis]|uniref:hypothetical protein n=1 Tax=Bacillus thuringiensis TaxID=1428 RepID=UPI0020C47132|nr:hypothetical protein [Bacillus thuringiensis]